MDDLHTIVARLRLQGTDDGRVEVKASRTALSKDIWDTVSAFANTDGGTILLGVAEDAGFTPVPGFALDRVRDQFVDGMGDGNSSGARVTNPPNYRLERGELEGQPILVIEVAENPPDLKPCFVTSKGIGAGSYRRVDDKDIRLSSMEVLGLQTALHPSSTDREVVPEATVQDLDEKLVAALIEARSASRAVTGVTNRREQLQRLNVLDGSGGVRLAALLTLGTYPQQFLPRLMVDVTVHPTVEKAAGDQLRFLDRVACEGPMTDVVDQAIDAVRRNLRTFVVIEGVGRKDQLEIPVAVLREAIANALVHRDYHPLHRGQPVTVDIYPDRILVTSPGGLWGGKTISTLADGQSRARNQTLLQLLMYVPLASGEGTVVEGQGSGIPMMNRLMSAQALAVPDYHSTTPDAVRVELRRHGVELPELRAWVRELIPDGATPQEITATVIAKREGHVDVPMLHRALGLDSDDVRALLRGLVQAGLLRAAGPEDYVLTSEPGTPHGAGLEVLNVLSTTEPLSIHDIAKVTERAVGSLRPVLRRLLEEGRIQATAPPTSRHRKYLRISAAARGH